MNRQPTRTALTRFAPRLEQLSDRVVPSTTADLTGGVLTITGDSSDNDIQITDDGTTVTVTSDGGTAQDFTGVDKIVVKGSSGSDTVSYDLTSDGTVAVNRTVDVQLGNGSDTFTGTLSGDLIDASTLSINVDAGNGKDTMNLTGTGNVASGATLDVSLDGGNGKDVVDSSYAGQLLGTLTWSVDGGNGKDDLTANPTLAAGSTGSADVEIKGGHGKDTMTLQVVDNSGDDGDPNTVDTSSLTGATYTVDSGHPKDALDISDDVKVV